MDILEQQLTDRSDRYPSPQKLRVRHQTQKYMNRSKHHKDDNHCTNTMDETERKRAISACHRAQSWTLDWPSCLKLWDGRLVSFQSTANTLDNRGNPQCFHPLDFRAPLTVFAYCYGAIWCCDAVVVVQHTKPLKMLEIFKMLKISENA